MATATTATTVIFPWSDAYRVGVQAIDTQHQGLIRLINELHTSMAAGQGQQVLGKILDDLVRYTETHFTYEEMVLRQRGYSQLTNHKTVHQKLTREVMELRNQFKAHKITVTLDVLKFLKNWLADHILVHDQAYAKELKTR